VTMRDRPRLRSCPISPGRWSPRNAGWTPLAGGDDRRLGPFQIAARLRAPRRQVFRGKPPFREIDGTPAWSPERRSRTGPGRRTPTGAIVTDMPEVLSTGWSPAAVEITPPRQRLVRIGRPGGGDGTRPDRFYGEAGPLTRPGGIARPVQGGAGPKVRSDLSAWSRLRCNTSPGATYGELPVSIRLLFPPCRWGVRQADIRCQFAHPACRHGSSTILPCQSDAVAPFAFFTLRHTRLGRPA